VYYWRLKQMYPGDPEFSLGAYALLPFNYVLEAYTKGTELRRESLHDSERPIAMVSSILANKDRDPKKNRKGYSYEDFSFYKPAGGINGPEDYFGSAMVSLAKQRKLPPWALFCFKEVTSGADLNYTPENCAFIAKDAMLLHPTRSGNGWTGLLIAQESASLQARVFTDDHGNKYTLSVPHIHTKVVCEEGVVLN